MIGPSVPPRAVIVNDDQVSSDHTLEGLRTLLSARRNRGVVDPRASGVLSRCRSGVQEDAKTVKPKALALEAAPLCWMMNVPSVRRCRRTPMGFAQLWGE